MYKKETYKKKTYKKAKYKKGTLLQEYFLNPHFKPTPKEVLELNEFFRKKPLTKDAEGGTIA